MIQEIYFRKIDYHLESKSFIKGKQMKVMAILIYMG